MSKETLILLMVLPAIAVVLIVGIWFLCKMDSSRVSLMLNKDKLYKCFSRLNNRTKRLPSGAAKTLITDKIERATEAFCRSMNEIYDHHFPEPKESDSRVRLFESDVDLILNKSKGN